ncbi:hypothetical protein DUI87_21243 [Hirundo rustica rustica]|uniref:Uncharacterized protein n=1 Tax=Hirundo rustica rustica TaxID=333673 RepID=A0A3M0JP70_HIRRU|nr:hypothetical protein DUI87_21243 [Hirundo rustica rustica]
MSHPSWLPPKSTNEPLGHVTARMETTHTFGTPSISVSTQQTPKKFAPVVAPKPKYNPYKQPGGDGNTLEYEIIGKCSGVGKRWKNGWFLVGDFVEYGKIHVVTCLKGDFLPPPPPPVDDLGNITSSQGAFPPPPPLDDVTYNVQVKEISQPPQAPSKTNVPGAEGTVGPLLCFESLAVTFADICGIHLQSFTCELGAETEPGDRSVGVAEVHANPGGKTLEERRSSLDAEIDSLTSILADLESSSPYKPRTQQGSGTSSSSTAATPSVSTPVTGHKRMIIPNQPPLTATKKSTAKGPGQPAPIPVTPVGTLKPQPVPASYATASTPSRPAFNVQVRTAQPSPHYQPPSPQPGHYSSLGPGQPYATAPSRQPAAPQYGAPQPHGPGYGYAPPPGRPTEPTYGYAPPQGRYQEPYYGGYGGRNGSEAPYVPQSSWKAEPAYPASNAMGQAAPGLYQPPGTKKTYITDPVLAPQPPALQQKAIEPKVKIHAFSLEKNGLSGQGRSCSVYATGGFLLGCHQEVCMQSRAWRGYVKKIQTEGVELGCCKLAQGKEVIVKIHIYSTPAFGWHKVEVKLPQPKQVMVLLKDATLQWIEIAALGCPGDHSGYPSSGPASSTPAFRPEDELEHLTKKMLYDMENPPSDDYFGSGVTCGVTTPGKSLADQQIKVF